MFYMVYTFMIIMIKSIKVIFDGLMLKIGYFKSVLMFSIAVLANRSRFNINIIALSILINFQRRIGTKKTYNRLICTFYIFII